MTFIAQLLASKGASVHTVAPDASVYEAVSTMADRGVGALIVMEGIQVVGVISERDYARKVILQDRSSKTTRVRDIMTTRVIVGRLDQTIEQGMAVMTDKRIRHLPIMDNERLVGIVSIGDLVKAIIADQQFVIEQLVRYIAG